MKKLLICLLIGLSVVVARQYIAKPSLTGGREFPGRVGECEPPPDNQPGGPAGG